MRHAMLGTVFVEQVAASDTEPRLQAAVRIMQTGMNHLAVARGCFGPDLTLLLQQENVVAVTRQSARHRQADHPGTDHDAFDGIAHRAD